MYDSLDRWIKRNYGSKKGLLRSTLYAMPMRIGYFNKIKKIEFRNVNRLIFICHGNICRSPLAEAVAKAAGYTAESYGLNCTDNHPADPRAIGFAKNINLDLEHHQTRHIQHYRPLPGDLLVGMEPAHEAKLREIYGKQMPITLAGLWTSKNLPYIHDPFNTCPEFFTHCEQLVLAAVRGIVNEISAANE